MEYRLGLAAGTLLAGEYRINGTLRQDGFSITYDAEDLQLKRLVLIKEYFPAEIADRVRATTIRPKSTRQVSVLSWGRQRFIEEAQTLTKFGHPGIARVKRVFEENNTAYAVIEGEDWPTLLAFVDKLHRQPTQNELDQVARQLLDSVEVLHDAGVLVRDLSPESIYVRDKRQLVLLDFGTAKSQFAGRARKMHTVVRPGYSAPEQYLFDDSQHGAWTDVFSLGAVLYRLYTGRSPLEVIHRHHNDDMPRAAATATKGYRIEFLKAIDRAMSLPIADRPQSIKAFRALLLDPGKAPPKAPEADSLAAPAAAPKSVEPTPKPAEATAKPAAEPRPAPTPQPPPQTAPTPIARPTAPPAATSPAQTASPTSRPTQPMSPAPAQPAARPQGLPPGIPASAIPTGLLSDKSAEEDRLDLSALGALPEPEPDPQPAKPEATKPGRSSDATPLKPDPEKAAEVDPMALSNRRFTIAVTAIIVGLVSIIGLGLITLERTLRQDRPALTQDQPKQPKAGDQASLADDADRKRRAEEASKAAVERRSAAEAELQRLEEAERRRREQAGKAAEQKRQAEEAEARKQEEARVAAERKRQAEESERQRQEEAKRTAEEKRIAAETERKRRDEETRKAAEEKRAAEEAERKRVAEAAEQKRLAEETERKRLDDERKAAEQKRLAEAAERKRIEDEARRVAEQKKIAEDAEKKRVEEERRAAEQKKLAEAAERKRQEDEARRLAEQKRLADEAERKRVEDARRAAEQKRLAEEAERLRQEQARREAEQRRLADDAERRRKEEAVQAAEQRVVAQISTESSRDGLLKIAAANAAQRPTVERRLAELGYLKISSSAGEIWRKPGGGEPFRDCDTCPALMVVPGGQFLLGSPAGEPGRQEDEDDTPGPGGAPVPVTIPRPLAVTRAEITRGDFAAFVAETRHKMDGGCYVRVDAFELFPDLSWKSPGFPQDDEHPVACVSWLDAKAYAAWLSKKTGATYRLLSEAEWEFAARGAPKPVAQPRFPFGNSDRDLCAFGNGADESAKKIFPQWRVAACNDGYGHTAPAGSFEPNAAGLHDMLGNLWEWVEDCYHDSYKTLPAQSRTTGAPYVDGCVQDLRVLRGGSWSDQPDSLRPASRIAIPADKRIQIGGFRLARELGQ